MSIFASAKNKISSFRGCRGVELLEDTLHSNTFFTISLWDDLGALEDYRNSELFKATWIETKILFAEKAEAWSLERKM
ncbi:MAG: putative quinol monooxygenase [Chitinophagales bacterium]